MPAVTNYGVSDLFVLRIIKHHASNPDRKWSNSYEFQADVAGSTDELLTMATAFTLFEAAMSTNTTVFDRVIISSWQADSVPYDPTAFISSSLTATGTVLPATNPVALTTALSVTRTAPSGRFGHLFYRNFLREGDISAPSGVDVLDDRAGVQDAIDAALLSSGADAYIGLAATGGLHLVLVDKLGSAIRPVLNLFAQGVTRLPLDHAWFNRSSPV